MPEAEGLGVERLAGAELEAVLHKRLVGGRPLASQDLAPAVALVAEQRVADALHVGADLVGAARLQDALHERGVAKPLHHAPVGHRRLAHSRAGSKGLHPQAVLGVAPDVALYAPRVALHVAPHQGVVLPVCGLVVELLAQRGLGLGSLGHHEQPARVLVDAVHQPHLRVVGVKLAHVPQVPGYGVDERAVEVARAGMHHHSGRLVDHHQRAVLIHHFYGYVLGHDA